VDWIFAWVGTCDAILSAAGGFGRFGGLWWESAAGIELIDKLVDCKLLCYYCQKPVSLIYHERKDPRQWTLERLNNNLGHYGENTCIACLKCNLGRRTDNHEYYKKGKTMILKKGT
jgi:hypothetical protein